MAIHQDRFNRAGTFAQVRVQPFAIKSIFQWLHPQNPDQRMRLDGLGIVVPEQGAKAARVAQAQDLLPESDVHMVMCLHRRIGGYDAQATRHAQM